MKADVAPRSAEATFTAGLLLAVGAAVVSLAIAIDWLRGSAFELGSIQALGLGLGLASILLGLAVLRSAVARRVAISLWPFGADAARPRDILAFAFWLAVASGIVEVGIRYFQFASGQRWGTLNPHAIWMVPLVDAATLLLLGAASAFFAGLRFPHLGSPRLAVFLLLVLALGAPISLYSTELRWISVGLLTLGLAFQGSRWIVAHPRGTRAWVQRTAVPMAVVVALVAIAPPVRQAWAEREALAGTPHPPAEAPNVLLIILDTVRAQNLSLHGYGRETTPGLERLAARSIVYDQAYAPSSWTLPSHGSFFTGRPPHQQSANGFTPLDDALPTLAEVMRDHGYYTLASVANDDNAYPHTGLNRGFLRYDAGIARAWEVREASSLGAGWVWILKRFGVSLPTRKDAATINERFLSLVDRRGARPFFAFLNYYDAHFPFDKPLPPTALIADWEGSTVPLVGKMDAYMTHWVDEYDREIAYLDEQLEVLFASLDQRGILENTIVIVTSDHGEEFMEHGKMGHGFNVYSSTLLVPLLIYGPGVVPQNVRVVRPVGLQDLPVTIVALAGIPGPSPFQGTDLISFAADSAGPAAPVLSELAVAEGSEKAPSRWNYRSLIWRGLHYIRNPDDSEEFYDVEEDPWELQNLMPAGENLPLAEFRAALSVLVGDLDVP